MILLFPLLALIVSIVAYTLDPIFPNLFASLSPFILPLLVLVMLGMGMTLKWKDFVKVWHYRKVVCVGITIQYLIMPFTAWLISLIFGLSEALTIGMMLVGATAGGTASNVMAYLAKGDLALSVSMTMISTLLASVMLPLITFIYLGQSVDVPVKSMLTTLIQVIVLPIAIGMTLNHFFHRQLTFLLAWFPRFSMAVILLIIAIVVGLNHQNLSILAYPVLGAVILHNVIGLSSGYWLTKKLGYDSIIARTVAIEVGMQNSGLSVALALKYFTPASALPGALFSIWHNLSGAIFASYWEKKSKRECERNH